MRKLLSFLMVLALVLPAAVIGLSANYENECLGAVNNYAGEIVLDGIKDPAYEEYGRHFVADAYEYVKGDPKPGFSADFWWILSNDYKTLHVFTEIIDPVLLMPGEANHADNSKCNHVDCVELWIDPTNEIFGYDDNSLVDREVFHYRCDYSGFNSGTLWGGRYLGNEACAPFFETVVTPTEGGYNIEWLIYAEVYEAMNLTKLERGDEWGIQMLAKNVFDTCHYQYEQEESGHRWDLSIYAMNTFTMKTSMCGDVGDYDTGNFDYIKLGNTVSDGDDPGEEPDDTDPVTPTDETTASDDPEQTSAPQDDTDPVETDPADPTDDTTAPDDDPGEQTSENTGEKEEETTANGDGPVKPVRPAGDSIAAALAVLIMSAGMAALVAVKRK